MDQVKAGTAKEILFLFTNEYPYGTGESFVENELKQHVDAFKEIRIFPLQHKGAARTVAGNIKVIELFGAAGYKPLNLLIRYFFSFTAIFVSEFFKTGSKGAFLERAAVWRSILLQNLYRAEITARYLKNDKQAGEIVFYSFWTDDWASVLSILKKQRKIPGFISRVHGYDLYKERWPGFIIPFRHFQLSKVSKIFAVSADGLSYLRNNYPQYRDKFYLSHLTIFDNGVAPFDEKSIFTIVSCSNLIPLKRVELIAASLAQLSFPLKWVHFGEGQQKNNIREQVSRLPATLEVALMGNVANAHILDFYKTTSVNAFVHVSETEGGVPLVLQEAASFGIPLIGTVAGGMAEIVTEQTGVPLPVQLKAEQLAAAITEFKQGNKNTAAFRKGVRQFWQERFAATLNYKKFYKDLMKK